MSREDFLRRLRAGLHGLPPSARADILTDYETHLAEGAAAGRNESEIVASLGDPDRLARELCAEAGLKRWEVERNPSAAASAVFAVLGLGAIDVLVLLPILLSIGGALLGFLIAAVVCFGAGAVLLTAGPFVILDAPIAALALGGPWHDGWGHFGWRGHDNRHHRPRQRPGLVRTFSHASAQARPRRPGDRRMIRTLVFIALVSFVLAMGSIAGALAIVGGPFSIDNTWRFHWETWSGLAADRSDRRALATAAPC